ncbi:putative reverse transcriptase domain-containing protein [Tanacetum coccineum]
MVPTRRSSSGNGANPNIAAIIAQQLQMIIPQIVTQVTNNVNNANANGGNGNGGNGNGGNGNGTSNRNPRNNGNQARRRAFNVNTVDALQDPNVATDSPEVFPKDLSGLPPQRQVKFHIDLVSRVTPVAKSPYRLAPSKMQELSEQLQELQDKRFIWPSHSPWRAPFKEDHKVHLKLVLELLKKEKLFAKFSKYSSKIGAVKTWKASKTPSEIRLFLGLAEGDFQTLKDNLCNAPILSLPKGSEDPVVYCDASNQGLGCVLMQRGKANVVADALSRKERVKPRRVRAMSMTIQSRIKEKLLAAQNEATKEENAPTEMLCGLDQQMEKKEDGGLYFMDRI